MRLRWSSVAGRKTMEAANNGGNRVPTKVTWRGTTYKSMNSCLVAARSRNISKEQVRIELGLRPPQSFGGGGNNRRQVQVDGVSYSSITAAHKATGRCCRVLSRLSTAPRSDGNHRNLRQKKPITLFGVTYGSRTEVLEKLNITYLVLKTLTGLYHNPNPRTRVNRTVAALCAEHNYTWDVETRTANPNK